MSELDWDDLRYFLAAARTGTLAGAARTLGVEHTTVGRRIAALERALGKALVSRGADGLQLTQLGERIAAQLGPFEEGVKRIRELAASESALVRLAVPSGFTRYFTAELSQFMKDHPGGALEIVSGATPANLSAGEADLALRTGPIADQELVARKLCEVGFALYASVDYARPVHLDNVHEHPLIGFHETLAHTPAARWLEAHAAAGANIVLRSRELSDMVIAASDGVGVALLPCSLADHEPRLRRHSAVLSRAPLSLVHRREARLSDAVKMVIAFVVATIKSNATAIGGTEPP